jgi:hypothetical protein
MLLCNAFPHLCACVLGSVTNYEKYTFSQCSTSVVVYKQNNMEPNGSDLRTVGSLAERTRRQRLSGGALC